MKSWALPTTPYCEGFCSRRSSESRVTGLSSAGKSIGELPHQLDSRRSSESRVTGLSSERELIRSIGCFCSLRGEGKVSRLSKPDLAIGSSPRIPARNVRNALASGFLRSNPEAGIYVDRLRIVAIACSNQSK
ncbi:hypothetical protein [Chamaesiphon polymorphus]|uniref:hypothetical protein n=1 Tax=Chamaesiphon polymorphus TaxID=2107691 RepID=UPI0011B28805|nr:hypothetical protein [Chamaesiphon polymorphus]